MGIMNESLGFQMHLADALGLVADTHIWEPFEAVCSCGAVPPVVNGRHDMNGHVADMLASAALAWVAARLDSEAMHAAIAASRYDNDGRDTPASTIVAEVKRLLGQS